MAISKLKVGVAGLGRMGKRHAMHLLQRTPRAELIAAFTLDESELFGDPPISKLLLFSFLDYYEMLKVEGLQAICIATITSVHAEQCVKGLIKLINFDFDLI